MYASLHQVLSETVPKALKITGGEEAKGTSKFTETMNKFFDCFNVHNYKHGIELCKSSQKTYTSDNAYLEINYKP